MNKNLSHVVLAGIFGLGLCLPTSRLQAQNREYPGYLGVYVQENDGGMEITGFIRRTPAAKLAAAGELNAHDTIVRLAGKRTRSLGELRGARNTIPYGKEGKMVLRTPDDAFYFVWISRNRPAVYGAAAPADEVRPGGPGRGEDEADIRDIPNGDNPSTDNGNPDIRGK